MSWFYCEVGQNLNGQIQLKNEIGKEIKEDGFYLFVGGKTNSQIYSDNKKTSVYVGVPIFDDNGHKKLLSHETSENDIPQNGHYVRLSYNQKNLIIQNDTLGLREVFFTKQRNNYIFSTRIDLLPNKELNLHNFSSLWLTNFQLKNNSIFNNINRLGPGGKIHLFENELKVENSSFRHPASTKSFDQNQFGKTLASYSKIIHPEGKKTTLALSGGIDSRLMLSSLINSESIFNCHTLLNDETKDIKISKQLTRILGLNHITIEREEINLSSLESCFNDYSMIPPVIPISQLADFSYFGREYLRNTLMLDGGFGGIYRRQYLNKIYIRGAKRFSLNNEAELKTLFSAPKPEIFNPEIQNHLTDSLTSSIRDLINLFEPPKNKQGLAEILDTIAIYFMLPNIYGPGQTILDQFTTSIMPLAQSDSLTSGLEVNNKIRENSVFVKKVIHNQIPALTKVNLVNNNFEYPFKLNYKLAMISRLLVSRIKQKQTLNRYNIYKNSKEQIFDIVNSSIFNNQDVLNKRKAKTEIELFFSGKSNGGYIDWFFTMFFWLRNNRIL